MDDDETASIAALEGLLQAVREFNDRMERVHQCSSRLNDNLRSLERHATAVDTTLRAAIYESRNAERDESGRMQ
ncbi:hypothetical protein CDCA_CDCA03G1052 [Cyanidium caldarium]|uniref:Uncharacterized protein n=1 Tax=Cyanidium caldarium TaxID=2771 RepID=A0AAV9IRZ8_CYACA|nr:hypothetical protein CDCA_CDCA03G1052 [Cyanidium caldarium]|eukprot:ctg_660.g348